MDHLCILCDHPTIGHFGTGCHRDSFLRGACDCDFVEPSALGASATPEQHRERAAWWARRIDATDRLVARGGHSSDRWLRLDRFRRAAEVERRRHLDAARARAAEAASEAPVNEPGEGLLDLISIETITRQPVDTLHHLIEHLELSGSASREDVRARLEVEFDALEPRHRRELLEDPELRGFLAYVGVVTMWSSESLPRPADAMADHATCAERLLEAFRVVLRGTLATVPFEAALAQEFRDTFGDTFWAQTEDADHPLPRDEAFLSRYRTMRGQLETYWRHWAAAPSADVQHAVIVQHAAAFERQVRLAIQLLTPIEKARFGARDELFGWVASGMQPLSVDGVPVALTELIEPRYLVQPDG
jgi:hypothetical protein